MTIKRIIKGALLALVLAVAAPLPAPPLPSVDASDFSIDSQLMFTIYNNVNQSGALNNFPFDQAAHVLSLTVHNNSAFAYTPCFSVSITDPHSGVVIFSGGTVTLKRPLAAGETRRCFLTDFDTSGAGFTGTMDTNFQNDIENSFKSGDVQKTIDRIIKTNYLACVQPVDCSGGNIGKSSCYNLTFFTQNPGADCTVAVLINPHNNGVPDGNVTFVWMAASTNKVNCPPAQVHYQLQVLEGSQDGPLFDSVDVPAGQTYYQWGPNNKPFKPGVKYFWRVVGIDCSGKTFCGPGNQGWSVIKWFIINQGAGSACSYTLADIDAYVRKNATPAQQEELKKWIIARISKGMGFSDPLICRMLHGEATLKSLTIKKK